MDPGGRADASVCPRFRGPALGRPNVARPQCELSPIAVRKHRCSLGYRLVLKFRPPWSLRSHHSLISLSPVGSRRRRALMVGEISARHALSKRADRGGVNERTGGVPLFVEEVTRLLSGAWRARRRTSHPADLAAGPLQRASIGWARRVRSHRLVRFSDRDFVVCAAA